MHPVTEPSTLSLRLQSFDVNYRLSAGATTSRMYFSNDHANTAGSKRCSVKIGEDRGKIGLFAEIRRKNSLSQN